MVFSSIPVYLDPPNWHHHHQQQPPNQLLQPQPQPPSASYEAPTHHLLPPPQPGSIRPGSMADRARTAKIPQPEPGLKCPRCESTNTKFCYFNNYSLTQPRHFCKTCRRYWTRGGALRNVPVGGGCRRNKKSSSNKSAKNSSSSTGSAGTSEMMVMGQLPPFMASSHLPDQFGAGNNTSNINNNLGLNFGGAMGMFQMGISSSSMVQQFPFFEAGPPGGSSSSLYASFHQEEGVDHDEEEAPVEVGDGEISNLATTTTTQQRQRQLLTAGGSSSTRVNNSSSHSHSQQLGPVKPELAISQQGLNLSRPPQFADPDGNHQYWGGGNAVSWTDLTGLNSNNNN